MKNILNELYYYDLFHLTEIKDMDGSYRATLDWLVKSESKLKKTIPTTLIFSTSISQRILTYTTSPTVMSYRRASMSALET